MSSTDQNSYIGFKRHISEVFYTLLFRSDSFDPPQHSTLRPWLTHPPLSLTRSRVRVGGLQGQADVVGAAADAASGLGVVVPAVRMW